MIVAFLLRNMRRYIGMAAFVGILMIPLGGTPPALAYQNTQNEQEDLFNQALQAYNQNRLSDARTLFERIRGARADEANKYVVKIKAYIDAMQVADSIVRRSPDELDAENLDFAIKEYQEAIAIKSDGPWNPQEKLEKANALRAKAAQHSRSIAENRDKEFCEKALDASRAHRYKQAELFSCPLANDNPAYLCGGDEAVHMCQEMRDLAKLNPGTQEPGTGPKPTTDRDSTASDTALAKAKAAYDNNDFKRARALFQRMSSEDKPAAAEYLDKMDRYETAMQQAEKASRELKYQEARAAYQDAATIKQDGPGGPTQRAPLMDLQQGIDEFYSGNYSQADQQLEAYAHESSERAELARFYLGASKLARFFVEGARDGALREQALNDLRVAKKAGFEPNGQEVSPKILKAYQELSF
jgi:hypothetical protein